MTHNLEDRREKQGGRGGRIMALALLILYASLILTTYFFRRHSSIYKNLGMTELPYTTTLAIRLVDATKEWWWGMGVVFVAAAGLAWSGYLGRMGWMAIALVVFIAVTLPVVFYAILESPLASLRAHLEH